MQHEIVRPPYNYKRKGSRCAKQLPQILALLNKGRNQKYISYELGISIGHLSRVFTKYIDTTYTLNRDGEEALNQIGTVSL